MSEPASLMTTREAARLLRVSGATVRRMAIDGRLTAVRKLPGATGAHLFERAEVERALTALEERYAS